MKVGFTGTQKGMTDSQLQWLLFFSVLCNVDEFHHGDCIGADSQAHDMVVRQKIPVYIHPPANQKKRAFCEGYEEIYSEKEYLDRNHDIVDATDVLIATPSGYEEELRSGTWATIRYARKKMKRCMIVYPDGRVEVENGLG